MADGSLHLDFGQELVVDLFAGGGGASLGISRAYHHPDVAVNHNPIAIAVHKANHPETLHYTCDVFEVDPVEATGGRPVAVLWASPDCRHHSKAKGGKPRSKKVRALAWVVVKWAAACKPRLIHLENVEEFADWGPLLADGSPCKIRKGMIFRRWVRQLERLGYCVEHRELVAADYGAPTIRKRLYVIARCDGRPIVWPRPTHHRAGANGLPRWRAAAECIDWSTPARSIFDRPKPLADNTQRRIAKGLWRYVLNCAEPFIVGCGGRMGQSAPRPVSAPLQTVTAKADSCIAAPTLIQIGYGERAGQAPRVLDLGKPLGTVVAGGRKHALVVGHLSTLRGTSEAHLQGDNLADPLSTVTGQGTHHALIAAHITKFRANSIGSAIDAPLHTITAGGEMKRPAGAAHALGLVAAHLTAFGQNANGTDPRDPLQTALAGAVRYGVCSAFLEQANGGYYDGDGRDVRDPLSTICTSGANQRLVSAYLVKYYGTGGQWQGCSEPMHTVPSKDRMGLVQVVQVPGDLLSPELRFRAKAVADFLNRHLPEHFPEPADMVLLGSYVLADITLRMLAPRELARAQGFPDSYVLERGADGKPVTKTDQVRLIGNSVCPDVAEALIRANAADLIVLYGETAA